jgi:quinol monooxygenase YgiN
VGERLRPACATAGRRGSRWGRQQKDGHFLADAIAITQQSNDMQLSRRDWLTLSEDYGTGDIVAVVATFEPKEWRVDEFLEVMHFMVEYSRDEPGCIRYDLYEDGEGRYHVLEEYIDQLAVEAHRDSGHYRDYRAKVIEMLSSPISVTVMHRVDSTLG